MCTAAFQIDYYAFAKFGMHDSLADANTGTADASHTDVDGDTANRSHSDSSHYFGTSPSVAIEKSTNGFDADAAPGPEILAGSRVSVWTAPPPPWSRRAGRPSHPMTPIIFFEKKFSMFCVACHGADGTGNKMLGAPNLTDDAWLYGRGESTIIEGIVNGRNGVMPAHAEFLGDRLHLGQ